MAPQSQVIVHFLIPSVIHNSFMYSTRSCIDERPATHHSLAILDLAEEGGMRSTWPPRARS